MSFLFLTILQIIRSFVLWTAHLKSGNHSAKYFNFLFHWALNCFNVLILSVISNHFYFKFTKQEFWQDKHITLHQFWKYQNLRKHITLHHFRKYQNLRKHITLHQFWKYQSLRKHITLHQFWKYQNLRKQMTLHQFWKY